MVLFILRCDTMATLATALINNWSRLGHWTAYLHLSPGISLISDLVHDSGMLQSELFTCRSQNLVLAKLPSSGFWKFFK